jgi:hypothetical protein
MPERPLTIFGLVVVWLGLCPLMTRAGGVCGSMTPEQSANSVNVVFAGKVVVANQEAWRINHISLNRYFPYLHLTKDFGRYQTTFEVTRVWKGIVGARTTVVHRYRTGDASYSFLPGAEYIVYAGWYDGDLYTSNCYRTNPLSAASEDLLAFGPGAPPSPNPSSKTDLVRKLLVILLLLSTLGWLAWKARRRYGDQKIA